MAQDMVVADGGGGGDVGLDVMVAIGRRLAIASGAVAVTVSIIPSGVGIAPLVGEGASVEPGVLGAAVSVGRTMDTGVIAFIKSSA